MRGMSRAGLLGPILLLVTCVACDPQGPGAMGQLTVSDGVNEDAGRTLQIRAFPDDGQLFDAAAAMLSDQGSRLSESLDLAQVELPMEYWIGGGIGNTEFERWRVLAWFAESDSVERPRIGEWYGTRLFVLAKCGFPFSGYCGIVPGIDVEINRRIE